MKAQIEENIPDSKKTLSHHRVLAAVADRDWDLSVPDRLTPFPPGLVSSPVTIGQRKAATSVVR